MKKIDKAYNLKIVSLLVGLAFLMNSTVYGIDLPQKAHLRVPLSGSNGRMGKAGALIAGAKDLTELSDNIKETLKQLNFLRANLSKHIEDKKRDLRSAINSLKEERDKPWYSRISPGDKRKRESMMGEVRKLRRETNFLRTDQEENSQQVDKVVADYKQGLIVILEQGFGRYKSLQEDLVSNERLYAEFNEQLINKYLMPELEKLKLHDKMTEEEIDEYLNLVREQLREGTEALDSHDRSKFTDEDRKRVRKRTNRIEELRRKASAYGLDYAVGVEHGLQDRAYTRIIGLLIRSERTKWVRLVVQHIEQQKLPPALYASTKEAINQFFKRNWDDLESPPNFEEVSPALTRIDEETLSDHFIVTDVQNRWEIVKNSFFIKETFGERAFDELEKDLADISLERLLQTKEHTDRSVQLGYRLFWLVSENSNLKVELAPFLIINAYREPGYSGEKPFLSVHQSNNDTVLYKVVSSLTEEELSQLRKKNMPGLMQVIDAILAYPDTFRMDSVDNSAWRRFEEALKMRGFLDRYLSGPADINEIASEYQNKSGEQIWDPKEGKLVDITEVVEEVAQEIGVTPDITKGKNKYILNPTYGIIQQGLLQMSLTMMEEGSEAKQFFIMGLLKRLSGVDLGGGYSILKDILINSENKTLQDELLQMLVSKAGQGKYGDFNAVLLPLQIFQDVSPELRGAIRRKAPKLFGGFLGRDALEWEHIKLLAHVLEEEPPIVKATINFINVVSDIYDFGWGGSYSADDLASYIELANEEGALDVVKELANYGYRFQIGHANVIGEMIQRRAEIVGAISQIRELFPDFDYLLAYRHEWNDKKKESETVYIIDPYEILAIRKNTEELLRRLYSVQRERGTISRGFTDGLLRSLRARWTKLHLPPYLPELSEDIYERFHSSIETLSTELFSETGRIRKHRDFYLNEHVLMYLARRPDRIDDIISLTETTSQLFSLLRDGGPLHSNKDLIIQDIFANDNALKRAKDIETIFTKKVPYWQQLFLFTETRLGSQLDSATSAYPITELEGISVTQLIAEHRVAKVGDPAVPSRLELIINDPTTLAQLENGDISYIPFWALIGEYKRLAYRDYLKKTVEFSRANEEKAQADRRNRTGMSSQLHLEDGDYIHGSAIDVIDPVLLNGNLPYESLGEASKIDGYPFHVDFTRLSDQYIEQKENVDAVITDSLSGGYGAGGQLGVDGQLWYIYKRGVSSWEQGKIYGPSDYHTLILGGMPATEISGIILRNTETTLATAKRAVLDNGFYIPIYDLKGELLFTVGEYDRIRDDLNFSVQIEVWDYSLKTGRQRGSNPGAEFTVPTNEGHVKYYVKFTSSKDNEHIWNEYLADAIYRTLEIPVPDTKIVRVAGTHGHASRLLDIDDARGDVTVREQLKNGFLADALLANWDIPYASDRNTVVSEGEVYRIDNGGALLFRARGQRKSEEDFGPGGPVKELGIGTNRERLGWGMRQEYERFDLSEQDIITQAVTLKTRFTDEVIDNLVDAVRLARKDRDYLKSTLKHRRDYILSWVVTDVIKDRGADISKVLLKKNASSAEQESASSELGLKDVPAISGQIEEAMVLRKGNI